MTDSTSPQSIQYAPCRLVDPSEDVQAIPFANAIPLYESTTPQITCSQMIHSQTAYPQTAYPQTRRSSTSLLSTNSSLLKTIDMELELAKKRLRELNHIAFLNVYDTRPVHRLSICRSRLAKYNDDIYEAEKKIQDMSKRLTEMKIKNTIESSNNITMVEHEWLENQKRIVTLHKKHISEKSRLKNLKECVKYLTDKKNYIEHLRKNVNPRTYNDDVEVVKSAKVIASASHDVSVLLKCRRKARCEDYIRKYKINYVLKVNNFTENYMKKLEKMCNTHCFWNKRKSLRAHFDKIYGYDSH